MSQYYFCPLVYASVSIVKPFAPLICINTSKSIYLHASNNVFTFVLFMGVLIQEVITNWDVSDWMLQLPVVTMVVVQAWFGETVHGQNSEQTKHHFHTLGMIGIEHPISFILSSSSALILDTASVITCIIMTDKALCRTNNLLSAFVLALPNSELDDSR